MKHFRKSGGFTLVELVVSIAVASLVTMAATTVLMLALRVNRQTSDTASQQNTVRALLSTMEKAATDGNITKVVSELDSWQLLGVDISTGDDGEEVETEKAMFSFDSRDRTISANGIVVLEGVYASNAILEENGLLSISIETKEGIFESTVYCRLGVESGAGESTQPSAPSNPVSTLDKFLTALIGELNSSGTIKTGNHVGKYYSQWYIGGDAFNDLANDWNADTPWCACYVSWALVEAGMDSPRIVNDTTVHWYSHVDEFEKHFRAQVDSSIWKLRGEEISKGALIFFNLDQDIEADHIGVVYEITQDKEGNKYIITIEGNSAGRVAMRRYPINDDRILGYGVLSWP